MNEWELTNEEINDLLISQDIYSDTKLEPIIGRAYQKKLLEYMLGNCTTHRHGELGAARTHCWGCRQELRKAFDL